MSRSLNKKLAVCAAALAVSATSVVAPASVASAQSSDGPDLPLASINDASYVGAFALPDGLFGASDLNYSQGPIEVDGDSLFIVGHAHQQAIAEFTMPPLVNSTNIADLNTAGMAQPFATVLDRTNGANDQRIDRISGLDMIDDQLVVNTYEYYDASADNSDTTLVVRDPGDLANSDVVGFHRLEGAVRAAGWMTDIPIEWQNSLGGTHLTGHSSGIPIHSRASLGPSAYALDGNALLVENQPASVSTDRLLSFDLSNRLADDLENASGTNDLWTHISEARFGFVIPGTSTYLTVGSSAGHETGVGYKITQDNGEYCDGYCAYGADDYHNAYWMWDLDDLVDARNGAIEPHEIRPYAYGEFEQPFQTSGHNPIGGGSFDPATGTLYLSLLAANNELGPYSNPPIVVAYRFPNAGDSQSFLATGCEPHSDSIVRLYAAAFDRDPERGGFMFWFDAYRNAEHTLPSMAAFFVTSPEFQNTYGALDDRAFLAQLYHNILGREGEAGGMAFWLDQMASGVDRGTMLLRFAESPENIDRTETVQPFLGPFRNGVTGGFDCSRF